jgi:hypothetical protein
LINLLYYKKLNEVLETVKAHIQTNFKVPHPTLVAVGISVAITAVVVGIFYMADSSGMFRAEEAEALKKKGRSVTSTT